MTSIANFGGSNVSIDLMSSRFGLLAAVISERWRERERRSSGRRTGRQAYEELGILNLKAFARFWQQRRRRRCCCCRQTTHTQAHAHTSTRPLWLHSAHSAALNSLEAQIPQPNFPGWPPAPQAKAPTAQVSPADKQPRTHTRTHKHTLAWPRLFPSFSLFGRNLNFELAPQDSAAPPSRSVFHEWLAILRDGRKQHRMGDAQR